MAEVAAEAVLAMQAGGSAGVLAAALEEGSNFQYVVHQAAGMVSVQLGVSVAQALVRLRAYAFAQERLLADVAADVVARRLHFAERIDEAARRFYDARERQDPGAADRGVGRSREKRCSPERWWSWPTASSRTSTWWSCSPSSPTGAST